MPGVWCDYRSNVEQVSVDHVGSSLQLCFVSASFARKVHRTTITAEVSSAIAMSVWFRVTNVLFDYWHAEGLLLL